MSTLRNESDFVEVVPPLPLEEAGRSFLRWLRENHLALDDLHDDDVVVDVLRGLDGRSLGRYWISRRVLPPPESAVAAPRGPLAATGS